MRYLLLMLTLCLYGFTDTSAPVYKATVEWGDGLYTKYDEKRLTSSEGLIVFGSFNLKNETSRGIRFRARSLQFPSHDIILVRQNYTIYILDLKNEKKIGQFKIPSRGTPGVLSIVPGNDNITTLKTQFRILPKKGKIGRPGPLIKILLVYKNGMYVHKKRDTR